MEEIKKANCRKVHIAMANGMRLERIDEIRSIGHPSTMVRLLARLKNPEVKLYFEQWFDDEEDAEYEYHCLRRALDKAELIIRRGEKKW